MRVASDAEGRLVGQSSLPVGSEATSRQTVSRWRGAAGRLGVRVLHLRVGSLHTHLGTLAGNSLTPQNISSAF